MTENPTTPPPGSDELETKLGAFRAADSPAQADRVSRDRLMYRAGYAAGQRSTTPHDPQPAGEPSQPAAAPPSVEKSPVPEAEKVKPARGQSESDHDREDSVNKFWKVMGIVASMAAALAITWNWWPQDAGLGSPGLVSHVNKVPLQQSSFEHPIYGADAVPATIALKQVALALQDHHREQGKWIELANTDESGQPLLSWRVHLLPHLPGGEELYKKFHLDEPWNSEHNRALLNEMPAIYAHPRLTGDTTGKTRIMAPTGNKSMWQSPEAANQVASSHAVHQTVMLVISKEPVYWSQPEDWSPEIPSQPSPEQPKPAQEWTTKGLWIYEGRVFLGMADGLIHAVEIKELRHEESRPPEQQQEK